MVPAVTCPVSDQVCESRDLNVKLASVVVLKRSCQMIETVPEPWVKAHPFNKASYQKWLKTHPFKSGGHTRKQALKHKVACHIKTRHAVSSTRNPPKRRAKPSGKRIVISRPLKNTAVKPRRAVKATRALKAR